MPVKLREPIPWGQGAQRRDFAARSKNNPELLVLIGALTAKDTTIDTTLYLVDEVDRSKFNLLGCYGAEYESVERTEGILADFSQSAVVVTASLERLKAHALETQDISKFKLLREI